MNALDYVQGLCDYFRSTQGTRHAQQNSSQPATRQLNGLLHNAGIILITGQTCCNSEEPKRVWRPVCTGSIGRKKLKTEAATSSTTNPTRSVPGTELGESSSIVFRSMLWRLKLPSCRQVRFYFIAEALDECGGKSAGIRKIFFNVCHPEVFNTYINHTITCQSNATNLYYFF